MITVYTHSGGVLHPQPFSPGQSLPAETVWVDLKDPAPEEERLVEDALKIDAPTREEMAEIEPSSRVYQEGDATYMTATVITRADTSSPENSAVTFIRTPNVLVTLRYSDPHAFRTFVSRSCRQPGLATTSDAAFTALLDAIIDRCADLLERVGLDLDALSREIFAARHEKPKAAQTDLEEVIRRLGRLEDLTSKISESLVSIGRLLTFFTEPAPEAKPSKEHRSRIKALSRDTRSLTEHAAFLAHKSNFLLDATLGLINIRQTAIIKIFSVAAVVFLPPTLIASIYGMNFVHMPELEWEFGYASALLLMIVSAVLPYWFFKLRGWL